MPLRQFQEDRRERWRRLDQLLDRAVGGDFSNLTAAEGEELHTLYRQTASDLNRVQTRTGNPALHDYLEALVARAHAALAAPRSGGFFRAWVRILRHDFPAAVRRQRLAVAGAAAMMLAGALFGAVLTAVRPATATTFLGGAFPEHLRPPSERVDRDTDNAAMTPNFITPTRYFLFSVYLFTNNTRVSFLAFALGLTFGIGTAAVLFYNGVILGCIAFRYLAAGEGLFFLAWVGPHGAVEIPCILLAGGAGFVLGRALWRRTGSFGQLLRREAPGLAAMLLGLASWLIVAGAIEAGFSQIHPPLIPYAVKIAFAALLLAAFMYYLFFMPLKRPDSH